MWSVRNDRPDRWMVSARYRYCSRCLPTPFVNDTFHFSNTSHLSTPVATSQSSPTNILAEMSFTIQSIPSTSPSPVTALQGQIFQCLFSNSLLVPSSSTSAISSELNAPGCAVISSSKQTEQVNQSSVRGCQEFMYLRDLVCLQIQVETLPQVSEKYISKTSLACVHFWKESTTKHCLPLDRAGNIVPLYNRADGACRHCPLPK